MQRVAVYWMVYNLTGSAALLGAVGFASHIPLFLLAPFAGVWIDRRSKYKILLITQFFAMAQALLLAFLVLSGFAEIWHIFALSLLLGIINAFDSTCRQAFYVELLDDKKDISNAVALYSSLFHISRLVGPMVAGFLIASVGEGITFLVNGLSYIGVIASLLAIKRRAPEVIKRKVEGVWRELKEGFRYVLASVQIRSVLSFVMVVGVTGLSYNILLPIFAKDILGSGPVTLGLLTAFASVGALIGSLYLASRKDGKGLAKYIVAFAAVLGLALILFSFSFTFYISLVLMAAVGAGSMVHSAAANSFLQDMANDGNRGRVMGIYIFSHRGMIPFGELLMGFLASSFSAPAAMLFAGAVCLAAAAFLGPRLMASVGRA
jgi:MFS family permease